MREPVRQGASTRGRRFGRRSRNAVLVVHISSAGAWIGIDVVLAVLVFTAALTDDPRTAALCYQALQLFAIWPLLIAGLMCLGSGVALGYGTKYGIVRYWWVAAKLAVNLVFVALVPLSLQFTVAEAAAYGHRLATEPHAPAVISDLLFPPIVSPAGLLLAVVLAVYKPWGRIRKTSS